MMFQCSKSLSYLEDPQTPTASSIEIEAAGGATITCVAWCFFSARSWSSLVRLSSSRALMTTRDGDTVMWLSSLSVSLTEEVLAASSFSRLEGLLCRGVTMDGWYAAEDWAKRSVYAAPKSVRISYVLLDQFELVVCRKGEAETDLADTNLTPDKSRLGIIRDRFVMTSGYGRPALARSALAVAAQKFCSSILRLFVRV